MNKVFKIIGSAIAACAAVGIIAAGLVSQPSQAATVTIFVTNSVNGVYSTNTITTASDGAFNPTVYGLTNLVVISSNSVNGVLGTNTFQVSLPIGYSFGVTGGRMSFYSANPITQQNILVDFNTNGVTAAQLAAVVSNLIVEVKNTGLLK